MMSELQIGIVGCGYWGPNLLRNFSQMTCARLVMAADRKEERLERVQSRFPEIRATTDYHDFFHAGLDAVVVATPPATHFQIARECLLNGMNVLVEKPLTLNSNDAAELVAVADQANLTLMVGHTFEYNPAVRVLKSLITNGELGTIYYLDAVRANLGLYQPYLNAMWDLAPHDISILQYLLDQTPMEVSVQGSSSVFDGIADVVYLHFKFLHDIMAHVHVSWLSPCKTRRITIVGSEKMVVYDDIESTTKIKIYDKGVNTPPYTDTFGEWQCSYRNGDVVTPLIPADEPLQIECEHFVQSIINHTRPQSDGRSGLRVVQVLEAAQRSLDRNGNPECIAIDSLPQRRPPSTARAAQN